MGSETAAMSAAAGIVISHASPMSRTMPQPTCRQRRRPLPMPTMDDATTWLVLIGTPAMVPAMMTPAERRLRHEAVDGAEREDPPPDGADDGPTAERRAERDHDRGGHDDPHGHRRVRGPTRGDEHRGDDADRLLGVIRAVAEGEASRGDPLQAADDATDARRGSFQTAQRRSLQAPGDVSPG